jgi:hypothetical protein
MLLQQAPVPGREFVGEVHLSSSLLACNRRIKRADGSRLGWLQAVLWLE